jgi:hypothetical protein
VGVAAVLASALLILAPSVTMLTAASGVGPFLHVPIGGIVAVVILGYASAAAMIAIILRTRHAGVAWVSALFGAVIAMGVAAFPLIATSVAIAQDVGGFLPAVEELLACVRRLI